MKSKEVLTQVGTRTGLVLLWAQEDLTLVLALGLTVPSFMLEGERLPSCLVSVIAGLAALTNRLQNVIGTNTVQIHTELS